MADLWPRIMTKFGLLFLGFCNYAWAHLYFPIMGKQTL